MTTPELSEWGERCGWERAGFMSRAFQRAFHRVSGVRRLDCQRVAINARSPVWVRVHASLPAVVSVDLSNSQQLFHLLDALVTFVQAV